MNIFKDATFAELGAVMAPKAFEAFGEWMTGQTCGTVDRPGGMVAVVYAHDIERWVMQSIANGEPAREQGRYWD